jgi:glycerophosphoryl diester phosphodiesterase
VLFTAGKLQEQIKMLINSGLQIVASGHVTRLKWHRLRRSMADPEFGTAVMAEGFKLGASMELDLQVRGDGGFVVLHDDTLDRETTGTGPVALHSGAQLSALRYRAHDAALILSEDLAGLLTLAHPEALLQFDMKNTAEEVGQKGLDHFATYFADLPAGIILSGGSIPLIRALAERAPQIQRGYDPTDHLLDLWPVQGLAGVERALSEVLRDPVKPDMVYLQWEMILSAADLGLDMIALAHTEGVKVDAWTHHMQNPSAGFNPAEGQDFAKLLALKPDQITTDEPIATQAAWTAWSTL